MNAAGPKTRTRQGLTTGSCAAAAAKAACLRMAAITPPPVVDISTPDGSARLSVPLAASELLPDGCATASVVKDAGDDPDVTHGAAIEIHLRPLGPLLPAAPGQALPLALTLKAGAGVGVVTRPGLAIKVGQPAVTPGPRRQIELALAEALAQAGVSCNGFELTICIPGGEALAQKTLNPRLGIEGGLSILGSGGTVKAYSAKAWTDTIDTALDVAVAGGLTRVVLTTGRRSEAAARGIWPDVAEQAVIPMGDFFAHALTQAAAKGVRQVELVCFLGKALKMAQGLTNTHAGRAGQDFELLSGLAACAGAAPEVCAHLSECRTAREAFELLGWPDDQGLWKAVACALGAKALAQARSLAGPSLGLGLALLDFPGAPGQVPLPVCHVGEPAGFEGEGVLAKS